MAMEILVSIPKNYQKENTLKSKLNKSLNMLTDTATALKLMMMKFIPLQTLKHKNL